MISLIDSHAHLDMLDLKADIGNVLNSAQLNGVEKIIIPGVTVSAMPDIVELIEKYDCLFGAASCHPQDVNTWNQNSYETLNNILKHPKMVAVGETGLDYYWTKDNKDRQKEVFNAHIELAKENNLPLIIHNRDAHSDTLEFLRTAKTKGITGVMHCFSGSAELAQECIQEGFYIGLGGPVTFKNAKKPKEVALKVPLEKLMVETDSPYLTPHPYRGKRPNKPEYVKFVAEEIARIKNIDFEEVARVTTENAIRLFKLDG
jgi:TatD DNase family protein